MCVFYIKKTHSIAFYSKRTHSIVREHMVDSALLVLDAVSAGLPFVLIIIFRVGCTELAELLSTALSEFRNSLIFRVPPDYGPGTGEVLHTCPF